MGTILQIIVNVIIISPILWLAGRWLVGGAKAKFTDAIWIAVLGIIINAILGTFVYGALGLIVAAIVWMALIKHFFDAGWGKAILIGIVGLIILWVIEKYVIPLVLAFLGMAAAGLGGY
jgi:uncharacterized membrane protein